MTTGTTDGERVEVGLSDAGEYLAVSQHKHSDGRRYGGVAILALISGNLCGCGLFRKGRTAQSHRAALLLDVCLGSFHLGFNLAVLSLNHG